MVDKTHLPGRLAEKAVKIVDGAGRAGSAYLAEGRRMAEGAAVGMKEALRKQRETPEIIERASQRLHEAIARFEAEREAGEETAARLEQLEQELLADEFARFGRLYERAVNRTLRLREEQPEMDMTLEMPVPEHNDAQISAGLRGAAAGGFTAASLVALTALFGTATTGTAIAGLSGSALIGATLASLGGGSLAVGGLGITGGLAVVGGAFAIPAVAAGLHFWRKDVEKNYDMALQYEEKVNIAVKETDAKRKILREAGRFAQSLFHDLSVHRAVLDTMLDIFEQSLSFGRTRDAFAIAGEAVALMGRGMSISYRMEKTPSDMAAWSELQMIALAFARTEQQFGAYIVSLDGEFREAAEAALVIQEEQGGASPGVD